MRPKVRVEEATLILELIAFTLIGAGLLAAAKRVVLPLKAKRVSEKAAPDNRLYGVRGGVWVKEPNGSSHPFQNLLEQELCQRGMALYDLRHRPTENLLKTGEWEDTIATGPLDVAIIGRIIVHKTEIEETRCVSVQHVHTHTGKFFYKLGPDHPDYRAPNKVAHFNKLGGILLRDNESYYEESDSEFARRREIERLVDILTVEKYSLDVRFYGPNGVIRGGCTIMGPANGNQSLQNLVTETANQLASVTKLSLAAGQVALAELELDKYQPEIAAEPIIRRKL